MKKLLLTVALICLCYTSNSYAETYLKRMYQGCAKWNDYQKNENILFVKGEFANMRACKSYIEGWVGAGYASGIAVVRNAKDLVSSSVVGCRKKGVFINDPQPEIVSRLFVKFLDDNPKNFSRATGNVLDDALNEAYPCY